MNTLKRIEKIIRESAFDNKKKKAGLKFNPGLVLTGVRTTEPRSSKGNQGNRGQANWKMLKLLNRMVGSLHSFFLRKYKGALPKDDYKSFNLGNNSQHYQDLNLL